MKRTIYWFNKENIEAIREIAELEKRQLMPLFLLGNENEWLLEFGKLGIPVYAGMMEISWLQERIKKNSVLILISSEAARKELELLLTETQWQTSILPEEWCKDSPSAFLEVLCPLRDVVIRLLAPDGCPYDRAQTHRSLRRNLIEEAYEVLEAIDKDDVELLREELGDLLLQIVFHAQLEEEKGNFTLVDVVEGISEKLIRRHPHVFGERKSLGTVSALATWEEIKSLEKGKKGRKILEGVPPALPALLEALKLQEKAAKVGFDWKDVSAVWEKLREEEKEFLEAQNETEKEAEFGDILFTLANLSRFFSINPENVLREANQRFTRRFEFVETQVNQGLKDWCEYSEKELNDLWEQAKKAKETKKT